MSTQRWIGLLILLAAGVSAVALLLGSAFVAQTRAAAILEDLHSAMYHMSALEWRATAMGSVDEEVDDEMRSIQDEILGSLDQLEESAALQRSTIDEIEVLLAAVDSQLGFLEAGNVAEAAAIDEEVVDPLFAGVTAAVEESAHHAARHAARVFRITTVLLVVTVALGVVAAGLMVHRIERENSLVSLVASKDRFIATVSHELRTPLTAIRGLAEILGSDAIPVEPAERDQLLRVMVEQTREMSEIIDDLLVAARADIGTLSINPIPIPLRPVVEAVVGALEFKAGTTVTIEISPATSVVADPVRLRQILRNLLTNANRYGGQEIAVRAGSRLDRVRIEIADNGPGVEEADKARIFQPFGNSGKDKPTGSVGIGLFISRELARLMQGELTLQKVPVGSVFCLELPMAPVTDLVPEVALTGRP